MSDAGAITRPPDGHHLIDARGISKRFGAVIAVQSLSFAVPDRCVCGLLGPNAAGKSTTIRMLAGLLTPDEGELFVAGVDARRRGDEARRRTGYLPESAPVHPELRTREFLQFRAQLAGLYGKGARDAIDRSVAACQLAPVYGRLVGALSKGFRQRVGVAAAILGNPRLVILDEPSVGLDPNQLLEFRTLIRSLGRERTVLISSHILAEIDAVCDRAVLINGGRLVAEGTMEALRSGGGDRYVIEVKGAAARDVLAGVAGLGGLRDERGADGWTCFTAESLDAFDRREAIATALHDGGCLVRELRRERSSLEALFVRATAKPQPVGVRS
ncbi:MAG: ABC transporter ATP-binding protein [Phycisphaerae bacterium]|nr:ABC transporter ATP-binding protein [Phycisphaerae bacterium]